MFYIKSFSYKFCNIHRKASVLECLHKSRLFLISGLIPFAKHLALLAINFSSSERRMIFFGSLVVQVLLCSCYFSTCMGRQYPAVELNNVIRFSMLSRKSAFLWHSSKWDCRFGCFLQYGSGVEVLVYVALTPTFMWLICSNCILPWTSKFLGIFWKADTM